MRQVTAIALSATSVGVILSYLLWRRRNLKKWKAVGKVSKIYIYPLKSGKGNEVQEAMCTSLGPREITGDFSPLRDRSFVIYKNETKEFISAKTYPHALQISVVGQNGKVTFSYPGTANFELDVPTGDSGAFELELYRKEKIPSIDCGDEVGKWISQVILGVDSGLRIGYWSPTINTRRKAKELHWSEVYKILRDEDTGAYSDLSSYHLVTESSVDNLNSKVDEAEITPMHFRPNILVDGTHPYEEDDWDWIRIGEDALFRNYKPCTRCALVVLNPQTNLKEAKFEPITTLKKFRQVTDPKLKAIEKENPVMGLYMGLYGPDSKVKVGDLVYATFK